MNPSLSQQLRSLLPYVLFFLALPLVQATHNRAGEITYTQIGNLTIEATATIYSKASSTAADRDTIEICWGDGTCSSVVRINGPINGMGVPDGEILPNDIKRSLYRTTHTYGSINRYTMSVVDPNRNGGICNLNFPLSQNIQFYIRTTVTFFDPIFQDFNSSPILTQPPIDVACVGQPFIHNPGAFDPDNDSLAYELVTPLEREGQEVQDYTSPAVPPNVITMNAQGTIVWDSPHSPCPSGEFNIAFHVIEFRNGVPIDTLLRDMQIRVVECNNLPPQIASEREFCVVAGELLTFDVTATAPIMEADQLVNLTALGGPLSEGFVGPAEFESVVDYMAQPLSRTFRWQTICDHIADEPYKIIFRAQDNEPIFIPVENGVDTVFLSALHIVNIKVVGPPPEDLMAEPEQQDILLDWALPYDCEITTDEYFRGFTVWRRIGSNSFPIDDCEPGLEGRGYTKITSAPIQDIANGRYVYRDQELERGRTYCYRILAEFAQTTQGGFPFNEVESLPSAEICLQLNRDVPLIVENSVMQTDAVDGEIMVRWTRPRAEDLDTLQNPGPYIYELYRAVGFNPADNDFVLIPGAVFTANNFSDPIDTFFLDTGLNTVANPYTYRLAFYVDNIPEPLGFATAASSVFLSVASSDEFNILTWEEDVPWDNFDYEVFRWNGSTWVSIGMTPNPEFVDNDGLVNGIEYCYYVESSGSYGVNDIPSPLLNSSQEASSAPDWLLPFQLISGSVVWNTNCP
ncbi:MAG: gliding motility-associated C-terminal domain-containing protein, partial [Bacteroidota bacterium]